jgi:hypothetical protein
MSTSRSPTRSTPSTHKPNHYPRTRSDRRWPGCAASTTDCSATATAPDPPELDCAFESICETCTFFQTSIEFRPTLQAQHHDAEGKQQTHRAQLFAALLDRVDQDAS